ncbi:MAG: cofactor-independent phosphoglycerate mutase [Candidatus Omnitrophica bacterium]|nr:cofactor-independent phosphoglycerate mutase [Candidatus Omnitrophota bacterium]
MKYAVLVGDGMADFPNPDLDNKTPLEVAKTPHLDAIAKMGISGLTRTIPQGLAPGSDVGILSVLGYNPAEHYTGRAPLEAASMGIVLADNEYALRCNLITAEADTLIDYSAGHISSKEAKVLIEELDRKLADSGIRFHAGVSYRHLLVVNKTKAPAYEALDISQLRARPPHDITGGSISSNLPTGPGAELIVSLMERSRALLSAHDINTVRIDLGENPANMIWLWGGGKRPHLPKFSEMHHIQGGLISAVDLVKGIGRLINLDVLDVPGITGYYDTDYDAKASYAIEKLRKADFIFVHLESIDEAGHNKDLRQKIVAIEKFDRCIVGPIHEYLKKQGEYRIMVMSDHATPVSLGRHTEDPVPACICGSRIHADAVEVYSETAAKEGSLVVEQANKLMDFLLVGTQS